jgi:hypothetical protein
MGRLCLAALLLAGCASRIPGYDLAACPDHECSCAMPTWVEGVLPARPTAEKAKAAREVLNLTDAQVINYWFENKKGEVVLGVVEAKRSYEAEMKWNGKAFENAIMLETVCTH